jgi:hypothetical protein
MQRYLIRCRGGIIDARDGDRFTSLRDDGSRATVAVGELTKDDCIAGRGRVLSVTVLAERNAEAA